MGERKGKGDSRGLPPRCGCGRLWLLTPTSLFLCRPPFIVFSATFRLATTSPLPSSPHPYSPYSAPTGFCRILKLKPSHLI